MCKMENALETILEVGQRRNEAPLAAVEYLSELARVVEQKSLRKVVGISNDSKPLIVPRHMKTTAEVVPLRRSPTSSPPVERHQHPTPILTSDCMYDDSIP